MAISPQRHTIYLYSAHRAVIFAIVQLSCYFILIPFPTFYGRGRCCIACPFFAFPFLWLQITLFIQQPIVGFDEFMKVLAGKVRHTDVFEVISQKVSVLTCGLAAFHFTCYSSRRKHVNGLVGTRKRLRKLKCTIVAVLRHIQ